MRLQAVLLAAAAALTAGSASAASVEFRDAVARVTVIPEARSDIKIEVLNPNPRLPLQIRTEGDRTVVDGGLHRQIRDCSGRNEKSRVRVRDVGVIAWAERPQVIVHAPRDVVLSSNGAVSGEIGRAASLDLDNSGCSDWTIGDMTGDVAIHESGAGSIRMGQADRLEVHVSGAASIHATRVRQGLEARLSGAGGVKIDDFAGALRADVSGVGKVEVAGGRATSVRAQVSGVGGVEFDGQAESLDASISGMGGIRVKSVTGQVRKSVSGIGRVTVENQS